MKTKRPLRVSAESNPLLYFETIDELQYRQKLVSSFRFQISG